MSSDVIEFARRAPKAEIHLHLEGTLKAEQVLRMAHRNGIEISADLDAVAKRNDVKLSKSLTDLEKLQQLYVFKDLFTFLDLYCVCSCVLKTEEDFKELLLAYLTDAHKQNIVHAEVFVGYPTHLDRGVSFSTIQHGLEAAMAEAKASWGLSSALIIDIDRGQSEDRAFELLELAKPYIGKSIVGVGLAFAENKANRPSKFTKVYERAGRLGLHRVAHAGEAEGPEFVREAIESLHVERIDHGVRSIEDDSVIDLLVERQIPLTTCPLSNICLKVFPSLEQHCIRKLIDRGVIVTINSDDPAYFGGNLNENLVQTVRAHGLCLSEIYQIAKNSLEVSFLDESRKIELIDKLDLIYRDYSDRA